MARIHEKADAYMSNISCFQKIIDFQAKMGTQTTVATWFHTVQIAILAWRLCMEKVLEWRTFQKSRNGDDGGYSKLEKDLSDAIRCCHMGCEKRWLRSQNPRNRQEKQETRESQAHDFRISLEFFRTSSRIWKISSNINEFLADPSRTTDLGEHPSVLRADKQENICSTGPYRYSWYTSTKVAELWSIWSQNTPFT